MQSAKWAGLIDYLQGDLALPTAAVNIGLKHCEEKINLLPVVLWQYGLVTIEQLDQIFDWLEAA